MEVTGFDFLMHKFKCKSALICIQTAKWGMNTLKAVQTLLYCLTKTKHCKPYWIKLSLDMNQTSSGIIFTKLTKICNRNVYIFVKTSCKTVRETDNWTANAKAQQLMGQIAVASS